MKKLFTLFSLLLGSVFAQAQLATITGTITDQAGTLWTNASVRATFMPAPGKNGPYTWSGGAYSTQVSTTANGGGSFNLSLAPNTQIVPALSKWQIQICPNATAACSSLNISISGSSDITSQIMAATPGITGIAVTPLPIIYNNNEVQTIPLNQGALVYDTFLGYPKYWNGNNWYQLGNGGLAGAVLTGPINTQIITQPSGTTLSVNSLGNVFDASLFAGSDIGAKVNQASAQCISGSPCRVIIPPGAQYLFSTPIVFVPDETIECTSAGVVNNSGTSSTDIQLTYTGTGVGVSLNSNSDHFKGCSLILPTSSAATGVVMGGYSNWVEGSSIEGGGASAILLRISSVPGSTAGAEDNHFVQSRLSNFVGQGILLDHCNDCFVSDVTAYGVNGNTTGVTLTIDTAAGGTTIHNLSGGSSGLHGLVVRNSMSGTNPTWIFIDQFISDIASGDGWVFDSSLTSGNVGATILNSWSAGSGGAGVHISGGRIITLGGGNKIRSNNLDGILIDGSSAGAVVITGGNQILGNNIANVAGDSGIRSAGHPDGLTIIGNRVGNTPEVGGHQAYAFSTSSDIDNFNFSGNNCSQNNTSCLNVAAIVNAKLTAFGNTSETESVMPQRIPSYLDVLQLSAGEATVMPYTGAGMIGFGGNVHFDGTNYDTLTDTSSNGGFAFLGSYTSGTSCIYAIPTNTPSSGQTITPTNLANYCRFQISTSAIAALLPFSTPSLQINGGTTISNSNVLPQVGTPNVGQAACIKAAGPPVVIGYCSTVVSAGGACTCN